ncbi:MAG: hypothetical protein Kilf2KO_06220 [Rhodospirillales bacterium]
MPVELDFVAISTGTPGDAGAWNLQSDGRTVDGGTFSNPTGTAATYSKGQISLRASGSNANGFGAPDAYLDDLSSGRPAGLGVCSTFSGTQCNPSSDDNVSGTGEVLSLSFSEAVSLSSLMFFGSDHRAANGTLLVGGIERTLVNGVFADTLNDILYGDTFTFAYNFGQGNATQFHLGSTVAAIPLPPTLLLLAGAFGLLGFMKRRKAAAAIWSKSQVGGFAREEALRY